MEQPLDLDAMEAAVRRELDSKYSVREMALKNCRQIIRSSANAIRALHRSEHDEARTQLYGRLLATCAGCHAE